MTMLIGTPLSSSLSIIWGAGAGQVKYVLGSGLTSPGSVVASSSSCIGLLVAKAADWVGGGVLNNGSTEVGANVFIYSITAASVTAG